MVDEIQKKKSSNASLWPVIVLLVLVVAVALLGFFRGGEFSGKGGVSKSQVEGIVRDYLEAHPEEIIASVDAYQRKQFKQQADEAQKNVGAKKDELDHDPTSPVAGNPQGDVTVVEFFDYTCGFCKKVQPAVEQLVNDDKNVRFVFKELPILSPVSEIAARAALAVHAVQPDKYFAVHNALLQARITDKNSILEVVKQQGVDAEKVSQEMDKSSITDILKKNADLAQSIGVNGTPGFVIHDKLIPGAIGYEQLKAEVEAVRKGQR